MAGDGEGSLAEALDTGTAAETEAVESVASSEGGDAGTSEGAVQTTQSAEPEWRGPLNEMFSGLTAEMRKHLDEMRQDIRRAQQFRQPEPKREEHTQQKNQYDDLNYWLENKGDPKFYNYLQDIKKTADSRVAKLEQMFESQKREAVIAQNREKIAAHLQSQAEASAKEAKIPDALQEMYARFLVTDIQSGNNGRAHDPFRYDYRAAAKKFSSLIDGYVTAREKEKMKAAEAQKDKPATTSGGSSTKPAGSSKEGSMEELRSLVNAHYGK
jgi:hypothetical protein